MKTVMKIWTLVLVLCFSLQPLSAKGLPVPQTMEEVEAEKNLDQLLLLVQKRLAIMHEVARTKWNQNSKIEDKVRENQILNDLGQQGKKMGLDEQWIRKFFQAQLEAAKLIQKNDFEAWQAQGMGKFDSVFDLKTELRSYIDQINQELLELISVLQTKGYTKFVGRYLLPAPISTRPSDQVDSPVWEIALSPLSTVN